MTTDLSHRHSTLNLRHFALYAAAAAWPCPALFEQLKSLEETQQINYGDKLQPKSGEEGFWVESNLTGSSGVSRVKSENPSNFSSDKCEARASISPKPNRDSGAMGTKISSESGKPPVSPLVDDGGYLPRHTGETECGSNAPAIATGFTFTRPLVEPFGFEEGREV